MVDAQKIGVMRLVRSAIDGKAYPLPAGFRLEQALEVAQKHDIYCMLFYGAKTCGLPEEDPAMQQLFSHVYLDVAKSEQQKYELNRIFRAFDQNGVVYMPLKGAILRDLYPRSEMRAMGDADILIRQEQNEAISAILQDLGFVFRGESDHELIWKKPALYLELHKRLISTLNKEYSHYFEDPWAKAFLCPQSTTRYTLQPEEQFVYLFVHFAKHYRVGGIGIRHLVDLWVYRQKHPELEEEKILRSMNAMGLAVFYRNIQKTLEHWFADGKADEITELILEMLFANGSFGTMETRGMAPVIRKRLEGVSAKKIKRSRIWHSVFLNSYTMKNKYPLLRKVPFLLPFFWVVRWFDILVLHRNKIPVYFDRINAGTPEMLTAYEQSLRAVGLPFKE